MTRYRLIDFSRSIAAIAVLALHYNGFLIDADWGDALPGGTYAAPFEAIMRPIYVHGEYAVQFFWMISGFIFGFVYHGKNVSARNFAVRRFARLYPLHFVTLLLVAALQLLLVAQIATTLFFANNDLYHFTLNVFFISAWGFEDGFSFNGPIWSVSVELLIYACFWLFISFVPLRLVGAAALTVGFAILARGQVMPLVAFCGMIFFLGTTIFFVSTLMSRRMFLIASLCGLVAAALGFAFVPQLASSKTLLLALSFGPLLAFIAALDQVVGDRFGWIDVAARFGDLSFSIYLLHLPLILIIVNCFILMEVDRAVLSGSGVMLLAFIATTLVLAHVSLNRFEHPARRYFQRVFSR